MKTEIKALTKSKRTLYIYIYIYIYICNVRTRTTSQKYLATLKTLFFILKVLFLMKQIKHHNSFIYNTSQAEPH